MAAASVAVSILQARRWGLARRDPAVADFPGQVVYGAHGRWTRICTKRSFASVVGLETVRPERDAALVCGDGSRGGPPPLDPVTMLQATNNLSDDRTESLITAGRRPGRFPGLGLSDRAPDAKTIRAFRARLTKAGAIEALSARRPCDP